MRRALALVATLALAGCGEESSRTGKAVADPGADRKAAAASALTVKDFPAGWTAEAPDRSGEAMCTITEATERTGVGSAWLGFNHGELGGLSHRVFVFPDEAAAKSAFAVFSEMESLTCAADEFKATHAKEEGIEVVDIVTSSEPTTAIGDATAANHMTMVMREDGEEGEIKMDMVAVREARGIGVFLLTAQQPIDPTLRDRLLRVIANRLAKNAG